MQTKLLIIIGIAITGGIFGIAYGINQFDYYQDQKQLEEWRELRESLLSEIREEKINNQTSETPEISQISDEEKCAIQFDSIKREFEEDVKNNTKCDSDACPEYEPPLFSSALHSNDEFIDSGCAKFVEKWAYMTEDNDYTWNQVNWESFVNHHYAEPISDSQRNKKCAKLFDLIYQSKDDSDLLYELTETNEFRDNECASLVEEWEHLTEHDVWDIGLSWDKVVKESEK